MTLNRLAWGTFALFCTGALYANWHPGLWSVQGPLGWGKVLAWAAFFAFAAYSLHCTRHEDLLDTVRKVGAFYFGRQIMIDLYLGLGVALFLIYLHSGSLISVLIWLLPMLVFANQATLLYLALHFDSLVARFIG